MITQRIQRFGTQGTLGTTRAVIVIESLRDNETKTGQKLHEDLETIRVFYGDTFAVRFAEVQSADELQTLLIELREWVIASGGIGLFLHIECHGDKNGLELADRSQMSWSQLSPLLAQINLASSMNLFLWLACCYGGYFVTACRYNEVVPFACILGPGNDISAPTLLAFESAFYTELFRTRDVTGALTISGTVKPDITYINFSAVGVFRIALAARIRGIPPAERQQMRMLEEPLFAQLKRRFFALDQFPENADRFAVTYAEVSAQVEADEAART